MTYLVSTQNKKQDEKILVECDECQKQYERCFKNAEINFKKYNGKHICFSCECKKRKLPQNTKEYWKNDKIKEKHSKAIKNSEIYYESIKKRDLSGDKNGMYGKQHTKETKNKMSESRKGKTGENATAWKGGKTSVVKRLKGHIHRNYDWYFRVYQKDGFTCQHCGTNKNLDAHHIEPFNQIVKNLIEEKELDKNDHEGIISLIKDHPLIIDLDLSNGITLCRECHREVHGEYWGSHECQISKNFQQE